MSVEYGVEFGVAWVSDLDVGFVRECLAGEEIFLGEGVVRS